MTTGRKPKGSAAQYAKFLDAAKEAGADGEESAADALMGRMAESKPEPKRSHQRRVSRKATSDS